MGKTFRAYSLTIFAICVLGLLGSAAYGQDKDGDYHRGIVQDWSGHHVAYARFGPLKSLLAAQEDPRAIDAWQAAFRKDWNRWKHQGPRTETTEHRDWSIGLGTGSTAASMYPAKYNFSPTATPDCTNDYVVFPVNVAGTSSQPNIVAFNNLYSGTTPANGICNRTAVFGVDSGTAATTLWSYAVQGITGGGSVATSPSLSLDGKKVVFVETLTGNPAHFHVLAWRSGDGQASNLQSVTTPKVITTFSSTAPVATGSSGAATDLVLGSTTDTLSSPFVDFAHDWAYVGNDTGTLFRVKDVFCTSNSACSGGTPPAPSLDTTWGSGGGLATGCSGKLASPVRDSVTGNIFVGCSDGKLYGFTPSGGSLAHSPLAVGDGTAVGGIVDPPMIDAVNGFVYVTSVSSSVEVVVQASTTDLSGARTATLGAGSFSMHAADFNDAYFSSGTSTNWLLYDMGLNAGGTQIVLYGVGFGAGHVMDTGTPADSFAVSGSTPAEFSPVTEFLNGTTDQLFVSGLLNSTNFLEFNISTFPGGIAAFASEGTLGTSGIVIDNSSASSQASSMYFGTLGGTDTAVKLTQNGLN
ncbi:MAG: hypothetical protein ABSA96_02895 [Candidatus Acidiferrales bacterium]